MLFFFFYLGSAAERRKWSNFIKSTQFFCCCMNLVKVQRKICQVRCRGILQKTFFFFQKEHATKPSTNTSFFPRFSRAPGFLFLFRFYFFENNFIKFLREEERQSEKLTFWKSLVWESFDCNFLTVLGTMTTILAKTKTTNREDNVITLIFVVEILLNFLRFREYRL